MIQKFSKDIIEDVFRILVESKASYVIYELDKLSKLALETHRSKSKSIYDRKFEEILENIIFQSYINQD